MKITENAAVMDPAIAAVFASISARRVGKKYILNCGVCLWSCLCAKRL